MYYNVKRIMKAGQIEKGMYLIIKKEPFLVVEREFVNPGKGAAFVRCKLKGLHTGQVLRETIKTQETVEEANVVFKNAQFLYKDDSQIYVMEQENYEQHSLPSSGLEEKTYFLKEGEIYQVIFFNDVPIDIVIPPKVAMEVVYAPEALKGDTATSVNKNIECESGLKIRAPGFIKEGDKVMVNTDTMEYVERKN